MTDLTQVETLPLEDTDDEPMNLDIQPQLTPLDPFSNESLQEEVNKYGVAYGDDQDIETLAAELQQNRGLIRREQLAAIEQRERLEIQKQNVDALLASKVPFQDDYTPEEKAYIQDFARNMQDPTQMDPADPFLQPESVVEANYAATLMMQGVLPDHYDWTQQMEIQATEAGASAEDAERAKLRTNSQAMLRSMYEKGQEDVRGATYLKDALHQIEDRRKNRSLATGMLDLAKEGVPFRSRYAITNGDLLSDNLADYLRRKSNEYWSGDDLHKKAIIAEIMESTDSVEGLDANLFNPEFVLQYILHNTGAYHAMGWITDVTDVIPYIGAGLRMGFKVAAGSAERAIQGQLAGVAAKTAGVVRAAGAPKTSAKMMAYIKGEPLDAAFLSQAEGRSVIPKGWKEIEQDGFSIQTPGSVLHGADVDVLGAANRHTRAAIDRLDTANPNNVYRKMQEQVRVSRVVPDEEVLARVRKAVYDDVMKNNPKWADRVLDIQDAGVAATLKGGTVRLIEPKGALSNYQLEVLIGDVGGRMFDSIEVADRAAREFFGFTKGKKGEDALYSLRIHENGKVSIAARVDVDETTDGFRNAFKVRGDDSPDLQTPANNLFGRFFRSKSETTSRASQRAANVALSGAAKLEQEAANVLHASYSKLSRAGKREMREWADTWHGSDPKKPMHKLVDFKNSFVKLHGKNPTDGQLATFIDYTAMNAINWNTLNLTKRLHWSRQGYKMWGFDFKLADGTKASVRGKIMGKAITSRKIPWDMDEPFEVAAISRDLQEGQAIPVLGNFKFQKKRTIAGEQYDRKYFQDKLDRGWKLIKLADDGQEALAHLPQWKNQLAQGRVKFLLVEDATTQALPAKMVPFNPGFHRIYKHPYFLQAPILKKMEKGKAFFEGGVNIMNFRNQAHYQRYQGVIDEARKAYLAASKKGGGGKKVYEAWRKTRLSAALDWKAMKKLEARGVDFEESWKIKKDGEGWTPEELSGGRFDRVYMGGSKSKLSDVDQTSDLSKAMERDDRLATLTDSELGTKESPIYKAEDAEIINPLKAVEQQTASMVRARALDDLRIRAGEEFAANFGHLIKDADPVDIKKNPFYYLMNLKSLVDSASDPMLLRQAKSYQRGMYELFNSQTALDDWWNDNVGLWLKESGAAASDISSVRNGMHWAAEHITPRNTARMLKSITFNLGLGLWNPKQLLQQGVQFGSAAAIAGPQKAGSALFHFRLMRHALKNPDMMDEMAKRSAKFTGTDADAFKAMADGYARSGFHIVGNTTVYTDDMMPTTRIAKNLDWADSKKFFNEGEGFNRGTSWSLAFQRWVEENPGKLKGGKLTDDQIAEVLERANIYSGNMLASAKASWQRGLAGVPTQFWSFNARMMDMYWGKSLSTAEKIRLFTAQAALWGWPSAVGSALGVANVRRLKADLMPSQHLMQPPDNSDLATIAEEGGFTMFLRYLTGSDVDAADSLGSDGLQLGNVLADALRGGDVDFFDMILGASSKTVGAPMIAFDAGALGLRYLQDDHMDFDDFFTHVASIATGLNNVTKAAWMLHYQEIRTKSGKQISIEETTKMDAFLQAIGLNRYDVADFYTMKKRDYHIGLIQREASKEIKKIAGKIQKGNLSIEDIAKLEKRAYTLANSAGLEKHRAYNTLWGNAGKESVEDYSRRLSRYSKEQRERFEALAETYGWSR